MKKTFLIIFAAILFQASAWASGLFSPAEGKVLLLIGQDKKSIQEYIHFVGILPPGFMVYTSIQAMDGLFEPAIDRGAGIQDAQYLAKKYPNAVFQIGLYMVGALDDTIKGKYDENIDKLAAWIEQVRVPVYLRIGYEFDLPANKYDPQQYKKAYRYLVNKLNEKGLKNVSYVWHSYGVVQEEKPITLWYPGDDVVDWIAISYFNTYFHEDRVTMAGFAKDKGKPLMIAEASPSQIGVHQGVRSWQKWYEGFFDFIDRYNVRIASYINTDWDSLEMFKHQNWGDSRIQANPVIYNKWKALVKHPKFIKSSYKLFQKLK